MFTRAFANDKRGRSLGGSGKRWSKRSGASRSFFRSIVSSTMYVSHQTRATRRRGASGGDGRRAGAAAACVGAHDACSRPLQSPAPPHLPPPPPAAAEALSRCCCSSADTSTFCGTASASTSSASHDCTALAVFLLFVLRFDVCVFYCVLCVFCVRRFEAASSARTPSQASCPQSLPGGNARLAMPPQLCPSPSTTIPPSAHSPTSR